MMAHNDKTRVFFNSLMVSGVAVLEKLFFFVVNIIVARYLNVEDFGEYTTALGYATFFSTFVNIGINQTLVRAINLDSAHEREHLGNTLVSKTLLALVVFLFMTTSLLFTAYNENTIKLILIFGVVRIGNEYMTAFYSLYDAKERFNVSSIFNFAFSLSFLSTTLLVVLYKGDYFHFAYTRLAVVILTIAVLVFYTFRDFSVRFAREMLGKFIASAIPFGLYSIFWYSLQRINVLVLSMIYGTTPVGYFNNGFIFLVTLTFIPINMNKVLVPFLYKISYESDRAKYQFTFDVFSKFFSILSFFMFLMFFLFADKITLILFGDKYAPSIPVLKIVSFAIPFLFNMASTIITAIDRQDINTKILGYAMALNILFNFACIYPLGAAGAAVASVLTFIFIFAATHFFAYKHGIISLKKVVSINVNLSIISVILCFTHQLLETRLHWFGIAIYISVFFAVLVSLAMIRRDDIRIVRETLFGSSLKGNEKTEKL